jgi:putative membrane protein
VSDANAPANGPTASPVQIAALRGIGPAKALGVILAISLGVLAFLFWLIYFRPPALTSARFVNHLDAVNASLNGLSAVLVCAGLIAVKARRYERHMKLMFAALGSSAMFLVSYVVYHTFHPETKFTNPGAIRYVYFFVLISHIVLSGVAVPLILSSFYLALAGRMRGHKRVSKFTFPIWLYVSVTGVLIFAMLRTFNVPAGVP